MLIQKRSLFPSIVTAALILGAAGCGSKVGGTYMFSQTGTSLNTACSTITLNLTSNSNQVSANGGNGTCTETLTGYDNGNGTITVQSLTMTVINSQSNNGVTNQSCIYTGTLNISGNAVTGLLTSQSNTSYSYSNFQSYCGTLNITGTKN